MSFSRLSNFFNTASQNNYYSPLPSVVVGPSNNQNEDKSKSKIDEHALSDVELSSPPTTPRINTSNITTPRINKSDDESDDEDDSSTIYLDCENDEDIPDEDKNEDKTDNKKNDKENDDRAIYYDVINDDEEEKEDSAKREETLFKILKELKIIPDDPEDNSPKVKENISIDEHQQLLQDLKDLGVLFEGNETENNENNDTNLDDEQDKKQSSVLPSTSEILFYLTVLAGAGVSIPTAIYALVLLSGMSIKDAGEDIGAWWESMSTAKKILSIIFAASSEYVNTKLNVKFFGEFWDSLTTNLKKCFTGFKSFFASTFATILALGGAFAAGVLAFEGLIFSKPLATVFAALNSGLFFISRYIGVNRVLNRFMNRKNHNIQRNIIDEIDHLKGTFKVTLEEKLDQLVKELLQNKTPDEEKILTKSDFEIIFKSLADDLDRIKSSVGKKNCINEKTRGEQAAEIGANIFDNSLASFIATITMITFAHKTKTGVEAMSDDLKNINKLLQIIEGAPGGLASAMLFGVSAADFRTLCIESAYYLYHHPKEIPSFLKDLGFNVCATTSMFLVGTTIPGPNNEYNIPLDPASYWTFGISNALGAFFINFAATLKNYVERPDNKKPTLDQVTHHFRNPNLNAVPKELISNLNMFKPKTVKVLKPIFNKDEVQEPVALPEQVAVAAGGGYRR